MKGSSAPRRASFVALLVAAGPVAWGAATYTVNLQTELNGLDVRVETVDNPGGLVVRLTNATAQKVRCTLRLDAQPQPPARKTVYVDAGKTEDAPFMAKRRWFEVELRVECAPAAG